MSSTLPQWKHFEHEWKLPGTSWTLAGHSRALERTGFFLKEPKIVLDAGVDLGSPDIAIKMILVTHTHIDHSNALPMLLRHGTAGSMTHIFAPTPVIHRLMDFCKLSWSMKVDETDPLPEFYKPIAVDETTLVSGNVIQDGPNRTWRPVDPGLFLQEIQSCAGIAIRTIKLFHTVTTVGYVISTTKNKVKPEYTAADPKETTKLVMAAKARGECPTAQVEDMLVAFLCDTNIEVFYCEPQASEILFKCKTIIVECSFLDHDMKDEAEKRGHIMWHDLAPIVFKNPHITFVLIHFSLRYTDEQIRAHFDASTTLVRWKKSEGHPEPNVVLWLDTGICEYCIN